MLNKHEDCLGIKINQCPTGNPVQIRTTSVKIKLRYLFTSARLDKRFKELPSICGGQKKSSSKNKTNSRANVHNATPAFPNKVLSNFFKNKTIVLVAFSKLLFQHMQGMAGFNLPYPDILKFRVLTVSALQRSLVPSFPISLVGHQSPGNICTLNMTVCRRNSLPMNQDSDKAKSYWVCKRSIQDMLVVSIQSKFVMQHGNLEFFYIKHHSTSSSFLVARSRSKLSSFVVSLTSYVVNTRLIDEYSCVLCAKFHLLFLIRLHALKSIYQMCPAHGPQ